MLLYACACILAASLLWLLRPFSSKLPLPPGPTIFSFPWPEKDLARTFQTWTKKYGPVVSVNIGSRTFIILGTRNAAHDLLEKRGNIYSSRAASVFMDRYLSQGLNPAFMPYGPRWRIHRRFYNVLLNARAAQAYRRLQDVRSVQLIAEMLSTNAFSDAFYHYASDIMASLAYGMSWDKDDTRRRQLEQINEMAMFVLQNASWHTTLLDLFPLLDYLPMVIMSWRRQAAQLHAQTRQVYLDCGNAALREPGWNWMQEVHGRPEVTEMPWEDVCYGLGEVYVAGIHTSKMVLENFVTACTSYPEAVRSAQEELDSAIGTDRIPTFHDIDQLPYLAAFIAELMRWRPISPIGVPHALTEDDEYGGFRIPRDATVIANQWGINMDEEVYDSPEMFLPERHLQALDQPLSGFGFGRRACPGYHVARATIFIVAARLLWAYSIEKTADGPVFTVRSREHRRVIESTGSVDEKHILEEIKHSRKFAG